MAYHLDNYDQALVIDGWEKGIADNPYDGIADMRNVNVISIPGEVSVGFSTNIISPPAASPHVSTANASTDVVTFDSGYTTLESGMAITFSATTISGISTSTTYWLRMQTSTTAKLYTDFRASSLVDITSDGTGSATVITVDSPKASTMDDIGTPFIVDHAGRVWSNLQTGPSGFWTYLGNKPNNYSLGQGIVSFSPPGSSHDRFLFVFSASSIDYIKNPLVASSWSYQWNPSAGSVGAYSATPTSILQVIDGVNFTGSHEGFVDNADTVYYCDGYYIGSFFQTAVGTAFNPADNTTYTFANNSLLPAYDTANCLTQLGTSLLIGGSFNILYPWDRSSPNISYPVFLPEYNVKKLITLNTTTFIFMGSRGRIYQTNGTNANLYKKIPDHISGTIEPYFTWGGVCTTKNQIYFSIKATDNAGNAINQYGGIWAIDTDTQALRLTHQLSYGSYAGYAPVVIPNINLNASGSGLFIGWDNGSSTYGIDKTVSTPFTSSQTTIDSDLIPIGTFNKPRDLTRIEYLLSRPLVSGESITIKTRLLFNTVDTGYTTTLTDSTVGNYMNDAPINFQQARWVQFQIVLNSTASSPSYVRLRHIRILGLEGPTLATSQQLGI